MNLDFKTRHLLDQAQALTKPKAVADVAAGEGTTNAKSGPSFESLLESLQRLRSTGEAGSIEELDTQLRAADSLHEEARALSQRLREAFQARLASQE